MIGWTMFSERAFFTFVRLTEPGVDAEYNRWHFLDHRPENLALPGVAWGDRWKQSVRCKELATDVDPMFAAIDYVAMYWFRPPYSETLAAWNKLAEDSFRWGRGPQLPGVERPLRGFYAPVKGYVAPRILVAPDVLPFRPNLGMLVTLARYEDRFSRATHQQYTWYDRVRIPALLDVPGVAGAWTFSLHETVAKPWAPDVPSFEKDSLRLTLLYFDEDPAMTTKALREREAQLDADGGQAPSPESEQTLLSFPVESISPWDV
ncbi:MAG: hypothetical protein JWQ59_1103 [Cryobacterium sp.]|jgi:hypothetical protein|nr:hypothetical protein [Cryobacterium sp.]